MVGTKLQTGSNYSKLKDSNILFILGDMNFRNDIGF